MANERVAALLERIRRQAARPLTFMEVCGTHTMAVGRHGLRGLLPSGLTLLSGPGCPVCVTPAADIERAVRLSLRPRVAVATFGDMLRVPALSASLEEAAAKGGRVVMVYSPFEALELARRERGTEVVFAAVGFETTAPSIAAVVKEAKRTGTTNFSILPLCKRVPPALEFILSKGPALDGFLLPGHVSAVIGLAPYSFLPERGGRGVVAGFEPEDILEALLELVRLAGRGEKAVRNRYRRAVRPEGNPAALRVMEEVFESRTSRWRGIGPIPDSGLALREEYAFFDAERRFGLEGSLEEDGEEGGCICGEIMLGFRLPPDCPLFGSGCTPSRPAGPCMVSSEGSCAAWYKYGGKDD